MNRRFIMLLANQNASGPTYETPAYTNAHGSGNRPELNGLITCDIGLGATLQTPMLAGELNDGNTLGGNGYPTNGAAVAGLAITFDFSTIGAVLITEMKQYLVTGGAPSGIWKNQGWNGSTWIDIGANFTLSQNVLTTISLAGNTTGYTNYRWLGVSGVMDWAFYWAEIEFKIGNQL